MTDRTPSIAILVKMAGGLHARDPRMDDITRRVEEMYSAFPYPSPQTAGQNLRELRNLLTIFASENRYDFRGKRILDAGTGTGHRLIEAARCLPQTQFHAIDISQATLAIARQAAVEAGVSNIEFQRLNLMEDGAPIGSFDMILCMGVLHHLSDPAAGLRRLARHLAPGGLLFLYIYGALGGRERMRRKQVVSLLRGAADGDFERGIRLVRDLGFDTFEYGWNLNASDESCRNSLVVDAYLNVNEKLFDAPSIFELMRASGLHAFATYGLTLSQRGCLFDTRIAPGNKGFLETTALEKYLKSDELRQAYEKLTLRDRYRLIDFLFEPNGYTLVAFHEGGLQRFAPESRVAANTLRTADL